MSILQRQPVSRSLRKPDAFLVVSLTLLCTAAPLIPPKAAICAASGTAVLAVLSWYKRCRTAAPFSIFCVICFGLVLSGVRYFRSYWALVCFATRGSCAVYPGCGEQPHGFDGGLLTRPSDFSVRSRGSLQPPRSSAGTFFCIRTLRTSSKPLCPTYRWEC